MNASPWALPLTSQLRRIVIVEGWADWLTIPDTLETKIIGVRCAQDLPKLSDWLADYVIFPDIVVIPHNDKPDKQGRCAGQHYAGKLAESIPCRVWQWEKPSTGEDLNDFVCREGIDAARERIKHAV